MASPLAHPRVGVIVPRYKHSAVDRNRLKRRLRELARLALLPGIPSLDLVIRARPEAYDASFATLRAELGTARERMAGFTGT